MNEFVRSASIPTNGRGPAMESQRPTSDPPARPVAAALLTTIQEQLMLEEAVRELLDRLEGGGVLASEPPPPPQNKVAADAPAIGAGEACPLATEIANLGRASVRLRIVVGRALRRLHV